MSILVAHLGRRPVVGDGTYLAPNASLIGDVVVGAGSSVWFGAVLRGDLEPIRVGDRTSIQDNAVLHTTGGTTPTIVGDEVTVGHGVILHGCTVHDRVIVGMGTVVLDGAEIGSDVIVGAGSLVTIGKRIPSGVLALGRPARPVRDLTSADLASIRTAAADYAARTREYLG